VPEPPGGTASTSPEPPGGTASTSPDPPGDAASTSPRPPGGTDAEIDGEEATGVGIAGTAGSGRDGLGTDGLGPDGLRLFLARALRMLAYGGLAVVLVVYLERVGLDAPTIGVLLTLTLIGDTVISLWLTTHADRIGRRKVPMLAGALVGAASTAAAQPT